MLMRTRTAPASQPAALMRDLDALILQALPASPPATPHGLPAAQDERAGCGWYESSYELGRGLAVTEHEGFEWLDEGLPLSLWLQ